MLDYVSKSSTAGMGTSVVSLQDDVILSLHSELRGEPNYNREVVSKELAQVH